MKKGAATRSLETIACLGWGSLIWDPRHLPIRNGWFQDGPLLSVEFTRLSNNGRLTLVLDEHGTTVRCLWALMRCIDLAAAKEALRAREGCSAGDIGFWQQGERAPARIGDLPGWARSRGIGTVIWTALPHRFDFQGESKPRPTMEDAVSYLKHLVRKTEVRQI
jgi:hypothetical protein